MFTLEQVLDDHEALRRLIREHQVLLAEAQDRAARSVESGEAAIEAARQAARDAEERLMQAMHVMPAAFVIYDADERLVICNDQYLAAYPGMENVVKPGVKLETLFRVAIERGLYPDAIGREEEWIAHRLRLHRAGDAPGEVRVGEDSFIRVHANRTPRGDVVGCRIDITELKRNQLKLEDQARALEKANEEARWQALHDALTGLGNRRYMDEKLAESVESATRSGGSLALIHVGLDRFKQINDTIGHAAGDKILCHAAEVLRRTAGDEAFLSRIGGDEFIVILPGNPTKAQVEAIANRMIRRLSRPVELDGHPCRFGASIGVAISEAGEGLDATALMVNADIALYRAKENGRNRVEFFTKGLQAWIARTKSLADQILAGIERDEFFPVYQPQFSVKGLALRGVETLCRWRHPERGVLPPFEFLAVADDLNAMAEIDRILLRKARDDIERLRTEGLDLPQISFNIAAERLSEPDLDLQLAGLRRAGVEVAAELVESMSLDSLDESRRGAIEALKACDVRVEIDDFGSCRASIAGLMSVGPNAMKIDRQLVIPITQSERHLQLARALVEIGAALGIEVIAEGVETPEHIRLLTEMGCDALQGYGLGRPMPIEDLIVFLREERWRAMAVAA